MNREELGAHALATADWVPQLHYIVRLRDYASGNRKRLSRRTRRSAYALALPVVQDEHRDVQEVVVGDLERDIGGRLRQAGGTAPMRTCRVGHECGKQQQNRQAYGHASSCQVTSSRTSAVVRPEAPRPSSTICFAAFPRLFRAAGS